MNPDAMKFLQGLAEACHIFMKYADYITGAELDNGVGELCVEMPIDKMQVADKTRLESMGWLYDYETGCFVL